MPWVFQFDNPDLPLLFGDDFLSHWYYVPGPPSTSAVVDTAANVSAHLDEYAANPPSSIALVDGKPLPVTVSQLTSDASVLSVVQNANGSPYTLAIIDTAANVAGGSDLIGVLIAAGRVSSITRTDISGQSYSSYEDDYAGSAVIGQRYFFTGVTGQAYTGYEEDLDVNRGLTALRFTGVTTQLYSSFEYDYADRALIGSKYFFTGIAGQPYSAYEEDLDVNGRLSAIRFAGYSQQPAVIEYDYTNGVLSGSKLIFTSAHDPFLDYVAYEQDLDARGTLTGSKYYFPAPAGASYAGIEQRRDAGGHVLSYLYLGVTGQAYSSYEDDYAASGFSGAKYYFTNIAGQPYTGYEEDIDSSGKLAKLVYVGVTGEPYSSFEYDYTGGVFAGSKFYSTNIAGQSYLGLEQDLDAAWHLRKVVYTGMIGEPYSSSEQDFDAEGQVTTLRFTGVTTQPYSSFEYDYADGILTGSKYFFPIQKEDYLSYETDLDAHGALSLQIFNVYNGTHRIQGFQDNLTINSVFSDVTTGGGSNETFVYAPNFGNATVTDFAQHLSGPGRDSFVLPKSEFADFATMLIQTQNYQGDALITAYNGDHLTLSGLTKETLATLGSDFSFV
jgi:hypothetical protein